MQVWIEVEVIMCLRIRPDFLINGMITMDENSDATAFIQLKSN